MCVFGERGEQRLLNSTCMFEFSGNNQVHYTLSSQTVTTENYWIFAFISIAQKVQDLKVSSVTDVCMVLNPFLPSFFHDGCIVKISLFTMVYIHVQCVSKGTGTNMPISLKLDHHLDNLGYYLQRAISSFQRFYHIS